MDGVRVLLEELQYEILERRDAWAECLLIRGEEQWVGRGHDPDEALRNAVLAALPSYAARVMLERELLRRGATPAEDAPAVQAAPLEVAEPSRLDTGGGASGAVELPRAPLRLVEAPISARRQELLESLTELEARIATDRAELALCSPQRQRLVLLAWLSRARACHDASGGDTQVGMAVNRVIKVLRAFSEAWWPGMIAAFKLDARPEATHREVRSVLPQPPSTWAEVAEAAEEAALALEDEAGRDEHGWADASALEPAAPDPDSLLEEIYAVLGQRFGVFGPRQPKDIEPPSAPEAVSFGQKLRWIRESVEDTEKWALAMGRIRYFATGTESAELRRVVDPSFRPPRNWAALLRAPDEKRKLELEVNEALDAMPAASASQDELIRWLVRVLPLTSTHARRIEVAAFSLRDRVAEVEASQIPDSDRRLRRRLQKLKSALATMTEPELEALEAEPEIAEATTLDEEETTADRLFIPEDVLTRTRGKRALFVGNRADPVLHDRLADLFGFAGLDWTEATTRRVDAKVDSITGEAYDLVLGATGFLNHKTDDRIRRACARAGIPYFRVNRGRPQAVLMALARDLGVAHG